MSKGAEIQQGIPVDVRSATEPVILFQLAGEAFPRAVILADGTIKTGDGTVAPTPTGGGGAIADGAVTTVKLADDAVTSAKIADGTIVNADISSSAAIAQSKISGLVSALAAKLVSLAAADSTITVGGTATAPTVIVAKTLDSTYITDFSAAVTAILNTFDAKQEVAYATAAALPANTYANGSSGVGATLTGTSLGPLTVDGRAVIIGQRILVKNEVDTTHNGIYTVTVAGITLVSAYRLTRATDYDQADEIGPGDLVPVVSPAGTPGTANDATVWLSLAPTPFVVGTNSVTFAQVGSGSSTTRIAQAVVSSPVASVTFSSIPATYDDLVLSIVASSDAAGGLSAGVQFNGDTGNNYEYNAFRGANALLNITNQATQSDVYITQVSGTGDTAGAACAAEVRIPRYAGAVFHKVVLFHSGGLQGGTRWAVVGQGRWASSEAVTSITVLMEGAGNFAAGSTISLFGVR